MIAALAGRRIDAIDADVPRFPLPQVNYVRQQLRETLSAHTVSALVCAGACGADLIALDVAGELGLHRRLVLPTERQTFREESVTDRPGDWGGLFDKIANDTAKTNDLIELGLETDQQAFLTGNIAILDEAQSLAQDRKLGLLVIVVWEGTPRGEDDITFHFLKTAKNRGFSVAEVLTL